VAKAQTMMERIGLTRGKIALIAILTIALGGVVYLQYGQSDAAEEAPAASADSLPRRGARRTAGSAQSEATTSQNENDVQAGLTEFDQTKWKPPELTMVIAYDPFAVPASFPQPAREIVGSQMPDGSDMSAAEFTANQLAEEVERLQTQLEELMQRGVHVIVRQRDEYVAMIGDRTVHVGDEINGFTVTAIEPDGVRIERKSVE